jgi:hypothetical protein
MSLTTHADPYEATHTLSLILSLMLVMGRSPATTTTSSLSTGGRRGLLHAATRAAGTSDSTAGTGDSFFLLLNVLHLVHPTAPQPEAVQERRGARPRPNGGGVQRGADGRVVHVIHGHARIPGTGDHPRRGPRQRR